MTMKTTTMTIMFAIFATMSVATLNDVFAEEESTKYKMADDITPVLTFTFKDAVEIHEFPVFIMEDDFVENTGSPSFSVQGVVDKAPHLHKALDQAFKHKQSAASEWNYQLFEVDVDFVKNGESVKTLGYHDCYVDDYHVVTLRDDQESYMSSKTGFAIVDDIEFLCAGIDFLTEEHEKTWKTTYSYNDYGLSPYKFAEDVRTFVTFDFDQGVEKIEFPYFKTTSGFEEDVDNVTPGFLIESTITEHPLLNKAIDNARKVSGFTNGFNVDFEATVEFVKGDEVLRTLEYRDCRVSSAITKTLADKEDGFTGKSGFAIVDEIGVDCIGLSTVNETYDNLTGDTPVWKVSTVERVISTEQYPSGTGSTASVKFTYDNGVEMIDFPLFTQNDVLGFVDTTGNNANGTSFSQISIPPSFKLEGIVGDFPMLHKHVDDNLALTSTTGANNFIDMFDVDVDLVIDDEAVRGFNYNECRVTDYEVKSQRDKEDGYFKGFALSNIFEFECLGYHPNNPIYDSMYDNNDKAKTINSLDLKNTQTWSPGFYTQ